MKWVLLPLLWLLAAMLAGAVLWRLWRGQNVVLRGTWSPRVVRMVAVILVVLGVGVDRNRAAPLPQPTSSGKPQNDEALPPTVNGRMLPQWSQLQQPRSLWSTFKKDFVQFMRATPRPEAIAAQRAAWETLPPRLHSLVMADLEARAANRAAAPVAPDEALRTLEEAERAGVFDHWLCAYLWRRTGAGEGAEVRTKIELYTRLAQHARLTNALIRSQATALRFNQAPEVWRSKGGRPRLPFPGVPAGGGRFETRLPTEQQSQVLYQHLGIQNYFALQNAYAAADTGTWTRDGVARFTVAEDSAIPGLLRQGKRWVPRPGQVLRMERLDLVEAPAEKPVVLEHEWLGRIELPAGRVVSVWDLPGLLSAEATARLAKTISAALDGDVAAAVKLERALPLVQASLRSRLKVDGDKPGAARLRLILALFDDVVAVPPANPLLFQELGTSPASEGLRPGRRGP